MEEGDRQRGATVECNSGEQESKRRTKWENILREKLKYGRWENATKVWVTSPMKSHKK